MFNNPGFTLKDQIFWTLALFRKGMAEEVCRLKLGVLSIALWNLTAKFERRFLGLYAMWKAGTLPARRVRRKDTSPRPSPQGGERLSWMSSVI